MARIPSRTENPDGLHRRYHIEKANGHLCDPNAVYFVLRLDGRGDDEYHIEACRAAAKIYAENVEGTHLDRVGLELINLVADLEVEEALRRREEEYKKAVAGSSRSGESGQETDSLIRLIVEGGDQKTEFLAVTDELRKFAEEVRNYSAWFCFASVRMAEAILGEKIEKP